PQPMPATRAKSDPAPREARPMPEARPRNVPLHDTMDFADVNTQVAAPDLLDSLREAAAEGVVVEEAFAARESPTAPVDELPRVEGTLDAEDQPEAPEPEPARELSAAELAELRQVAGQLAREHRQSEATSAYEEILR